MTRAPKKLQQTVQVKDWGEPDARERSATFGFLKSKYDSEWPRDSYT